MTALTIRHRAWPAPETPAALPAPGEHGRGLTLTDRAVLRHGIPIVPVSGELHYSRMPRARWAERLRQLRALGVTVASTYVFWNHHVSERGRPRFDGDLDVAAFVDEVDAAGLELVLRIGPWAHGEVRNGGFPDWVRDADVRHRSDDPAYLALVREWFAQLAAALDGRARPGGPIIGIQVENELYDRPEHLSTLIRLAREAGMSAPLWTATAWGGAQLPAGEVVPLFGGYADGFWVDPDGGWQPNFRAHFFASHDWDDPGVGEDVRASQGFAADDGSASRQADLHGFPPATCELGSGMATAYHRRPVLAARDVAALAHVKIGNGSAWQGYYMFAGGRNPARGMQESQETGYPNDLPELGYDFHAPIGQSGDLHPSAHALRAQHAFLAAFGDRLGSMTSSLPDALPRGLGDRTTLRWALRSDGDEGFVFLSHHQPYEQVAAVRDVQLAVALDDETIVLPSVPVEIPAGTVARWPVGLHLDAPHGRTRLRWATASVLTLLPAGAATGPVLVAATTPGVPVEVCVEGEEPRVVGTGVHQIGTARLLVVDDALACGSAATTCTRPTASSPGTTTAWRYGMPRGSAGSTRPPGRGCRSRSRRRSLRRARSRRPSCVSRLACRRTTASAARATVRPCRPCSTTTRRSTGSSSARGRVTPCSTSTGRAMSRSCAWTARSSTTDSGTASAGRCRCRTSARRPRAR